MSATHGLISYLDDQPADWVKHFSLDRLQEPLRPEDKVHGV